MLVSIVEDLKKANELIVISEEVDPELVMAAIHLKVYAQQGPAILFEKVKGSDYQAMSNIFGTIKRSKYIFRKQWDKVEQTIAIRNNPMSAIKRPFAHIHTAFAAINALPRKVKWNPNKFKEIQITDLPLIKHWGMDGGAFITLPQVFSIDPDKDSIMQSNLGMYRVQLNGNDYETNKEIGMHYQIHRGIGIHHTKANLKNQPLQISIFVGGHPAHTLSAVMPLPEGLSELVFGGLLAGKRFQYAKDPNGNVVSMDADFVITGEISGDDVKPEGPFGDHLGYYSLTHPFPLMKVKKVYAKENAIWPFTVVGRPPQEDTSFGQLIHELTGGAIRQELPGIKEVHAVDAAGVHPLLLAIGSERYTPFMEVKQPAELLTQANHILGTGQLSLAKFLFIVAPEKEQDVISTYDEEAYFHYFLERVKWSRDVHFQTETTIDTLDYTGGKLNVGSKVIMAAHGAPLRSLDEKLPTSLQNISAKVVTKGILAIAAKTFTNHENAEEEIATIIQQFQQINKQDISGFPLIVICDDAAFLENNFQNFLWVTFTRANPAQDIYGVDAFTRFKHWGCEGALIIDARIKPYMPPALEMDEAVSRKADEILSKYWKDYHVL